MASGISTIFLSKKPKELCDRIKLSLQEKQAGINSEKNDEESVTTVDKLLEDKCISTEQHKQILIKCNLLRIHENKYSYNCLYTRTEIRKHVFVTNLIFKLNEKYEVGRRI